MSPLPHYAVPGKPETALVLIQHQRDLPAQVVLSHNLRDSGLLRFLPLDLLQLFVCLLTFHEAMGEVRASVEQLSEALELHPDLVEHRLLQLAALTYDDAPLVFQSAERVYSLSKRVGVPVDVSPPLPQAPVYRVMPREAVIEWSRRMYGTPRAEAEARVNEQLGIKPMEPVPEGRAGEAHRAMLAVGVPDADARRLLAENPIEIVERQIAWLPARGARNPARFLAAAIRGDYGSPEAYEMPEEPRVEEQT